VRQTLARHECVKYALQRAYNTLENTTCKVEPSTTSTTSEITVDAKNNTLDSQRRVDLKVVEPEGTQLLDVTIISLVVELAHTETLGALKRVELEKENKYRHLGSSFTPFVLS